MNEQYILETSHWLITSPYEHEITVNFINPALAVVVNQNGILVQPLRSNQMQSWFDRWGSERVNADSSDCEDEHDAYSYVYKINSAKSSDEFVKLEFLNSKVGAMAIVDTGAEVSVLPARMYKQLHPKSVDSNGEIQGLDACSMKLTAFNHTNINVMGQIRLPVKYQDVMKNIKFIVTNIETATIIGRNDAVDIHCVEFLCHNCDQCNDDDSMYV